MAIRDRLGTSEFLPLIAGDGDEAYANVMVNVLDQRESFPPPNPVNLDGENEADKRQRHRQNWTPAILRGG